MRCWKSDLEVAGTSSSKAGIAFISIYHLMRLILLDNICVEMLMNLLLFELENTTWGNAGTAEYCCWWRDGTEMFTDTLVFLQWLCWLGKDQLPNVFSIVTDLTLLYSFPLIQTKLAFHCASHTECLISQDFTNNTTLFNSLISVINNSYLINHE